MNERRYARQIVLPEVGRLGQRRLAESRILCVGVGGLGSPAAFYLAAAGCGTIGLIDPDRVDQTNLQRQILFGESGLGQLKVDEAAKRLNDLNPDVTIIKFPVALNSKNALQVMGQFDLVIDGTDNFAAKFLINDAAMKLGIPLVYGSVYRFEGHVAVFKRGFGPCYRCLYPEPPSEYVPNCAESGVLGAMAGIVGSIQALEAIKVVLSGMAPQFGRLLVVDGTHFGASSFMINKNDECPVCSMPQAEIELNDIAPACQWNGEISADELLEESLNNNLFKQVLLIDVREKEEWDRGRIPGARHFPLSRIEKNEFPDIESGCECIFYCHAGVRSKRAIGIIGASRPEASHRFRNLRGGFTSWRGPVER